MPFFGRLRERAKVPVFSLVGTPVCLECGIEMRVIVLAPAPADGKEEITYSCEKCGVQETPRVRRAPPRRQHLLKKQGSGLHRTVYGHDWKRPSHFARNLLVALAIVLIVAAFVWTTYDPKTLRLMSGFG